jgi:hypothetical protein
MIQVQPARTVLNVFRPIKYMARYAQNNLVLQAENKL